MPESNTESLHQPKSFDCLLARLVFRPIARFITPILARTPLTPNQLTVIAFGFALGSAACFSSMHPLWSRIGCILLFVAYTLDVTDGELARQTGQTSDLGLYLDPILDRIGETAILLAVGVGHYLATGFIWSLYFTATGAPALLIYFYIVDIRPSGKGIGQRRNGRVLASKKGTYIGLVDLYYGGAMIAGAFHRVDIWAYAISIVAVAGASFQIAVLPRRLKDLQSTSRN